MATKNLKTRIQNKTDTSSNWALATNFVPLKGEVCFFSDLNKVKIGDGATLLSGLSFIDSDKYVKPAAGIPGSDLADEYVTLSEAGLSDDIPTDADTLQGHNAAYFGTAAQITSLTEDLADKVDIAQGVEKAGQFLVVGSNGNVTTQTLQTWQGGNY